MRLIKLFIIGFILSLSLNSHAATFNPNLVAGAGPQLSDDSAFYIVIKSYLLESKSMQDTDLLGLGLGINTLGDVQFVLSPIGWTFFENFNIAPDIGLGINRGENVTLGISLGFIF